MFNDLKVCESDTVKTLNEKIQRNEKRKKLFLALSITLVAAAILATVLYFTLGDRDNIAAMAVYCAVFFASLLSSSTFLRLFQLLKRNNTDLIVAKKKIICIENAERKI